MKPNLIIRASAGTGKTFSLATRFIRLMVLEQVSPDRIVALTFSRAAAQEIYIKLLERLWEAALSDAGAKREKSILLDGLGAADRTAIAARRIDWSCAMFAECLRRVIDTQHHKAIATLDSFILRIVRSFPLEMGFQHAVGVLDEYGERAAVARSREALLADRTGGETFVGAFKTALRGMAVRACSQSLERILSGWRAFWVFHPEAKTWTADSMRAALGLADDPQLPDLSAVPTTGKRGDPRDGFVKHVLAFSEDGELFPRNKTGEMMLHFMRHPEAESFSYTTESGQEKTFDCGADGAAAIRAAVQYMVARKLIRQLEVVAAKLKLCSLVEDDYDAATRRRGQLTFSDFTDCQAANEDSERGLQIQNLQFRFDAHFDHWTLDEFQDTSELQWKCLRRLVREAASDGSRSVMAVGDLKQSIYTWRGGNDAPFKEMMDSWDEFRGEFGETVPNDVSYRYEKHTADFINAVFGPGNVRDGGVVGDACAEGVARWLSEDCWMEHRPDQKADGSPKDGDRVEVIGVPAEQEGPGDESVTGGDEEDGGSAAMRVLAPNICTCVKELWQRHEAARSTDTVGILVRNNKDGNYLAECLRSMKDVNLPVVWEGLGGILDSPVVRAVLELLKLANHAEDTFAWTVVDRLFPIREIVFPELVHAATVSAQVSRMLSRLGLARTLREIVARLVAPKNGLDARSVMLLEGLVREGVNFEDRRDITGDIGDFPDFLTARAGRESAASPHVIRILTIHRSKGLTFDHVIVPILETGTSESLVKPRKGCVLSGTGWVAGSVPEVVARVHPLLSAAWTVAANERFLEQLRMYYVALTRARKSTRVFVSLDAHGQVVQFRDLLLNPFAGFASQRRCAYGQVLFEAGEPPSFGQKAEVPVTYPPWVHKAGEGLVARRTPSSDILPLSHGTNVAMATLFDAGFGTSAQRGTIEHAEYAAIGWIDPGNPADERARDILSSGWREAFVKTEETVACWRERPYELFRDGVWESGQFDRVVFRRTNGVLLATIYDFKTNRRHGDETVPDFERRMRNTYESQMKMYRAALSALAQMPQDRIAIKLLLAETMTAVKV